MSEAPLAAGVAATDLVGVLQPGGPALATVAQIQAEPDARLAVLEARQGNVPLSGSLPIATLQVGTTDVPVPVPGLLPADRVSVMLMAAVPDGLRLGAMRPDAKPGVLLVQATAALSLAGKVALPLAVTAHR